MDLPSVQDQRVAFALELESLKPGHRHGVGYAIDEKHIADYRRAQSSPCPGVVRLDDVGMAPRPVQRLWTGT